MTTLLSKLGTSELSFTKLGISLIQSPTNLPGPVLRAGDTVVDRTKPVLVFVELNSPVGEMNILPGIPQKI